MKTQFFKPQPAYLVDAWQTEKIQGLAFDITIHDWGIQKMCMFSADDGVSYKQYHSYRIFYSLKEANEALIREKESYISFLKKEHNEKKDKLLKLGITDI